MVPDLRFTGAVEWMHSVSRGRSEAFKEKVNRLTATLRERMAEACRLDTVIETNLKELGFGR